MNDTKKSPAVLGALGIGPVQALLLGACPAAAVTGDLKTALVMGLTVLAVLLLSALVMAAVGWMVPARGRIALGALVAAVFVSAAQMLLNAYLPTVYAAMGIYLAVCAVDLLILAGGENASEAGMGKGLAQAFAAGVLFLIVAAAVGAIRELLGAGSLWGAQIAFLADLTIPALLQPYGGLIVFALVAAVVNKLWPCVCGQGRGQALAAAGAAGEDAPEKEGA